MNKFKAYCRNWYLFIAGFRWLWTHEIKEGPGPQRPRKYPWCILYKPGWTPLKFCLLVYWWDYGLATLLGRGCQSLSRAFELFGQRHHWGQTGPILWGSKDLWKL